MKVKTTISISDALLRAIDRKIKSKHYRSQFIETAMWIYLGRKRRNGRKPSDKDIINKHADELNREAEDVLSYQVLL
ncbi:MAG: hypothetical protein HY070_09685 [Chloroflexi bacterium]|nr:hypothetical protein [Chloroflexota bacterium]